MEAEIINGLIARGVAPHIAQGMVANMIAESGLNPGINEINPTVAGSRGGYGLNQWTGPRRRQYEAYASERGAPLDDLQTQLDFTMWEMQNTERGAWDAISAAPDAQSAARAYSDEFLRPCVPHMDRRLAGAARLSGGQYSNALAAPQQQPPQNALAAWKPQAIRNDPRAFTMQTNALAPPDYSQFRV